MEAPLAHQRHTAPRTLLICHPPLPPLCTLQPSPVDSRARPHCGSNLLQVHASRLLHDITGRLGVTLGRAYDCSRGTITLIPKKIPGSRQTNSTILPYIVQSWQISRLFLNTHLPICQQCPAAESSARSVWGRAFAPTGARRAGAGTAADRRYASMTFSGASARSVWGRAYARTISTRPGARNVAALPRINVTGAHDGESGSPVQQKWHYVFFHGVDCSGSPLPLMPKCSQLHSVKYTMSWRLRTGTSNGEFYCHKRSHTSS